MEEFKYLGGVQVSQCGGRRDCEIDNRLGARKAVMQLLCHSVVVKGELSSQAYPAVYLSNYIPTLTYSYELFTLLDRMRSSDIREELRVEPLLLLH